MAAKKQAEFSRKSRKSDDNKENELFNFAFNSQNRRRGHLFSFDSSKNLPKVQVAPKLEKMGLKLRRSARSLTRSSTEPANVVKKRVTFNEAVNVLLITPRKPEPEKQEVNPLRRSPRSQIRKNYCESSRSSSRQSIANKIAKTEIHKLKAEV